MQIIRVPDQRGGSDNPTRIRNCITDYVNNHGTLYIVLGGDNSVVPVRGTYVQVGSYVDSNCPTDFYYAGLDGNWDDGDADGVYGEVDVGGVYTQDEGDLYADVIVGRIPVRTTEHVTAYVNKLIAYETNPPSALLRKMMLSGKILWNSYNGDNRPSDLQNDGHTEFRAANHPWVSDAEMWTRRMHRDKVKGYGWMASPLGMMFDTLTSWDSTTAGDYAAGGANLVTRFSEGWNFVVNFTHGGTTLLAAEGDFGTSHAANLTGLTAHFRTAACLSGGFDQGEPSISEAMLRNPNGGALIYIGGARYGWGSPNPPPAWDSGYGGPSPQGIIDWLTEIFDKKNTQSGSAYFNAKALRAPWSVSPGSAYRWIYFSENLQGDPLVPIYGVKPVVRVSVNPAVIEEKGGSVAVFTFTRIDDIGGDLVVHYTRTGSATYGSDYFTSPATSPSGSITIPAGAASATITVTPVNDSASDPGETVVFAIAANTAYELAATDRSASVTIHDDDTIFILTDVNRLNVPEGRTAEFRVRLDNPVASDLAVSVGFVSGDEDLSVMAGAQLIFTPTNWNVWQTVTLAAAEDGDTANGAATISLTAPGVVSAAVTAIEADDDFTLTFEVSPSGAGATVPSGTVIVDPDDAPYPISATAEVSYLFSIWTVVSGTASFANANSASTTVTATANATIRANFAGNPNLVTSGLDTGDDAAIGASLVADIQDGNGLSLREAIHWASAGSTITFHGASPRVTLSGPITIAKNLTLDGGRVTTIDADQKGRIFYVYNGSSLLTVNLVGLTLENGRATATDADAYGGAIYSNGEILNLTDCALRNCTAIGDAALNGNKVGYGGAIATNADLTLTNCIFENNTATGTNEGSITAWGRGGAVRSSGGALTVVNCVFMGNRATGQTSTNSQGGAIQKDGGTTVSITGGRFESNSASNNGGAVNIGNYPTTVDGTVFHNNSGGAGGALYCGGVLTLSNATFTANTGSGNGGAVYFDNSASIRNSTFGGPTAADGNTGAVGGAIYANASYDQRESATIENCLFRNNRATGAQGGAIYNNTGPLTIRSGIFADNSVAGTTGGGAIRNNASSSALMEVVGCLFTGNTANGSGADGGAIHNGGRLTLVNSTLHGNTAADQGGALYHDGSSTGWLFMAHATVTQNVSNGTGTGTNAAAAVRFNARQFAAIYSSILYGNTGTTSSKDISGGFDELRNSIVGQLVTAPSLSENVSNADPRLGALQNNGGVTWTQMPTRDSPALDAALPMNPVHLPIRDRYGVLRGVASLTGIVPGANTDAEGQVHLWIGAAQGGEPPVVRFYRDSARTQQVAVSSPYTPGSGTVTLNVTPVNGSGLGGSFTFNPSAFSPIEANDNNNQIHNNSYSNLTGLAFSNTDEGRLYITISVTDGTATAYFYKDSARTQLVATSDSWTAATVGAKNVTAANGSGIGGSITTSGTPTADNDIYALVLPADRFLAIRAYTTDARGDGYPRIVGAAADIGAAEAEQTTRYAVTYNANGATGGSAPTDPNSPYLAGATVTVLGNSGHLTRTGYTFAGWNTAADGSGTSYAPGATFLMPAAPVTLFAQWTPTPYQGWANAVVWNPGDDSSPSGDPDGDGILNLLEYAFGLNPLESNINTAVVTPGTVEVVAEGRSQTRPTLTFTPQNTRGLRFIIEGTSDLRMGWPEQERVDVTTHVEAGQSYTYVDRVDLSDSGSCRFLRLRVEEVEP